MTHPAEPQDELLQCFDENGHPTEARTRAEVKELPPKYWYAVARVWLVNDLGQIMVSKRSNELTGNPGKWQTYFGGHVGAGQSIKETAKRELEEEAGVNNQIDDFILVDQGRVEEKKVLFEGFGVRFNGQPSDLGFKDAEVTEAKWMDMEDYWRDKNEHPDDWCNSCPPEIQSKLMSMIKGQ